MRDAAGGAVLDPPLTAACRPGPGEEAVLRLHGTVKKPEKWTAETPHLYTLVLTLKGPGGKVHPPLFFSCKDN